MPEHLSFERLTVPVQESGEDLALVTDAWQRLPGIGGPLLRVVLRWDLGHGASMPVEADKQRRRQGGRGRCAHVTVALMAKRQCQPTARSASH
jgi:hypothetical protein